MIQLRTLASFLIAATVLLSSCVSTPPPPDPNLALGVIGDRYVGKNILEMVSRFGAPIRKMDVDKFTVYSWEKQTTMYFQTQPPLNVRCQLDAYADSDGIVRNVGFSGQRGAACENFAQ